MDREEVVHVDRAECLALLGSGRIGRVVYTAGALPAAQPVAFVLDGGEVLFGTPVAGELAEATRNAVVAFQTDQIDCGSGEGWTVLGIGETYDVTDPSRVGLLAERTPAGVGAIGGRVVALPLARLTGRWIEVRQPAPRRRFRPFRQVQRPWPGRAGGVSLDGYRPDETR